MLSMSEGPLGRATPPPFRFMLGSQLQAGERKHAIWSWRLQKDDIMATCIRYILKVMLALHILCDISCEGGGHFSQSEDESMATCIQDTSKVVLALHMSAMWVPMAGNRFRNFATKWRQGHVKHLSSSSKVHVVRRMAHETLKIASVKHAVVFADGAPEAKNAQVIGHNQNFEGLNKRRNSDRNGQKSDKSK